MTQLMTLINLVINQLQLSSSFLLKTTKMNCSEINKICLISILSSIGYNPIKIAREDHWYLSPFREEKKPSFKVCRELNLFYDFGLGCGGTVIDFLIRYYDCTVRQAVERISSCNFSFQQQPIQSIRRYNPVKRRSIIIERIEPIHSYNLVAYLQERGIDAPLYPLIDEVSYKANGYSFKAIGFKNDLGGYELRSAQFKGCTNKAITSIIKNSSKLINVFEGFFDYLSYLKLQKECCQDESYLILNSLVNIKDAYDLLDKFSNIELYLDADAAGRNTTKELLQKYENLAIDKSTLYADYQDCKDVNEFLLKQLNRV